MMNDYNGTFALNILNTLYKYYDQDLSYNYVYLGSLNTTGYINSIDQKLRTITAVSDSTTRGVLGYLGNRIGFLYAKAGAYLKSSSSSVHFLILDDYGNFEFWYTGTDTQYQFTSDGKYYVIKL